jgi:hypothetical protein
MFLRKFGIYLQRNSIYEVPNIESITSNTHTYTNKLVTSIKQMFITELLRKVRLSCARAKVLEEVNKNSTVLNFKWDFLFKINENTC